MVAQVLNKLLNKREANSYSSLWSHIACEEVLLNLRKQFT